MYSDPVDEGRKFLQKVRSTYEITVKPKNTAVNF